MLSDGRFVQRCFLGIERCNINGTVMRKSVHISLLIVYALFLTVSRRYFCSQSSSYLKVMLSCHRLYVKLSAATRPFVSVIIQI